MGLPLVDPKQQEAFLEAAESLGYERDEFGFVARGYVDASTTAGAVQRYALHISRGDLRRDYPHGGPDVRWLGEALKDLYAGIFGAPSGAKTWLMAIVIPEGRLKGKWIVDAYFTLKDESRVEFSNARLYDTEADALKAGSEWLRNHLRANRARLA